MLASMKSSRRKQSKPIRVSLEEEAEIAATKTQLQQNSDSKENCGTVPNNNIPEPGNAPEEEPMEASVTPEELQENRSSPLNLNKKSEFPTEYKKSEFPTEYHRLANQLGTTENTNNNFVPNGHSTEEEETKPQEIRNQADFPTAYHRLGSELFKDQSYTTNGHSDSISENKDSNTINNSPTPDSESKEANGEVSFKSDGTRIFHPDAYCELCDREFCNKYFLKTHKANKHGIYDNSPSPFSMANFPFTSPPEGFPTSLQPPATEQASLPNRPELMNFLPIKTDVSLPLPAQTMPTPERSMSDSINPDMEDYCEICQKHFCNKYYLKKHKQDVHGITPDTSSNRRRPQLDTSPSSSTVTSAPLILPQNMNSMANVMVLNPFVPPMIIQAQPFMAQHPLALGPPTPVSIAPVISQSLPHTPSSSASIISNTSPSDSLRTGLFSVSEKFYCELCRKEFCNKNFLKLHMVNKHGIFSEDMKRFPSSLMSPMFGPPGTPEDFANLTKLSEIMKAVEMEKAGLKSSLGDLNITFCTICNMEFSSKYSYKIHKLNVHGILSDSAASPEIGEIMKADVNIKIEPDTEHSRPPSQQSSGFPSNSECGASSMFGSMIAAKLADRVQCDICNKELCNKYFLKAHKMKLHGIDISLSDKDAKSESGSYESKLKEERGAKVIRDLVKEIEAQGNANKIPERPPERELVKLGIDPEAYCEICKKEFCSKYFLRTHKLKLHGIKTPKFDRSSGGRVQRPLLPLLDVPSRMPTDALNLSTTSNSLVTSNPTSNSFSNSFVHVTSSEALVAAAMSAAASVTATAMSTTTSAFNTSPTMASEASDSYERHTWRWKEPVNCSRVACEICNKELCNKYFLRTHKLNKHGISLEEQAKASPMSNVSSSEMPDSDTASSTSSTSEQTKIAKDEKRSQTLQKLSESLKLKLEDELSVNTKPYDHQESCSLCNRRFKNLHKLQLHLMKDHSLLSPPKLQILPAGTRSLDWLNSQRSSCHLCSAEFPDLLTLQLHLIQEHNAQVSLKPEPPVNHERRPSHISMSLKTKYSRSTKPKVYSCLHCDYRTRWLSNIYSHEERKHKLGNSNPSYYPCSICLKSFLYEHSYLRHLQDFHQRTDITLKDLSPRRSYNSAHGGFNCRKCGTHFASRLQCVRHIRETHIRSAKSTASGKFSLTVKRFSCKKCAFSTRIPENLRRHKITKHRRSLKKSPNDNGIDHPMDLSKDAENVVNSQGKSISDESFLTQSFRLQDGHDNSNFIPAVIDMTVRSLVKSPVTVTFTLTPTEQ